MAHSAPRKFRRERKLIEQARFEQTRCQYPSASFHPAPRHRGHQSQALAQGCRGHSCACYGNARAPQSHRSHQPQSSTTSRTSISSHCAGDTPFLRAVAMAASRAARLSSGSQLRIVIIRRSMIGVTLPLRAASSRAFAVDRRTDVAGPTANQSNLDGDCLAGKQKSRSHHCAVLVRDPFQTFG